jgi:hypothetical protein
VRRILQESVIHFFEAVRPVSLARQVRDWVHDRIAGQPKGKAFVGWEIYYRAFLEASPGHALIDHRGPHVGDELQQSKIIAAIEAGRRVFQISAPPGCGKSRFALELARRIGREQRSWEVRFVRHDDSAIRAELPELTQLKRLVLIVDDAHECPKLLQLLAGVCSATDGRSPIHLVCLSRPTGRAAVTAALASHFPVGTPQEMELGRPSRQLVRELIDKRIPQVSPHHRDTIRRFVGDSFFAVVLICTSVARQKTLPQTLNPKHVRGYVLHQPIAQAARDLCPSEKALRALAVYAACAPVHVGDSAVRESAAASSGLSLSDLEVLEQRVLQGGLFQSDGQGLMRPIPDLLGDLILEETCLDEHGKPTAFGHALIRQLFTQDPAAVIRNCSDIGCLFSTPTDVDLLTRLVLARAEAARTADPSETLALLKSCVPLAACRPGTIVRLLEILETQGVLGQGSPSRDLQYNDNLEVHAQTLLLTACEYDATCVPRALEYSRRLLLASRADLRSLKPIFHSLSSHCRFAIGRPLAHTSAVLDVLSVWASASDSEQAELAASLVQGLLPLEAHGSRWEDDIPIPFAASVIPGDALWQLRDRALQVIVLCSRHESPAVQYAAANGLQQWAKGHGNLPEELRERWASQLQRELQLLTESFSKLGSTTLHLPVRGAVERQGWRWWINDVDAFVHRGGRQILDALPQDSAYSLWKALHDETLPVVKVLPADDSGGQEPRKHFLALTNTGEQHIAEVAGQLFDELDRVNEGTTAWSERYTTVLQALPKHPLQRHANLYLAEFVGRHANEAWSLVTEAATVGPLRIMLPLLLGELRRQDSPRWLAQIREYSPETRLFEAALRALWRASPLEPAERAMVTQGLQLDDESAVHLSAQALLNCPALLLAPGLSDVFAVIRTRPTDERLWELAIDAFGRWGDHMLSASPEEEPSGEARAMAGEFLMLFRTSGGAVPWNHGPHTRGLAKVLAIFATAIPHTLRAWMREVWSQWPETHAAAGDLPLSTLRLPEVVRLIAESSAAAYWKKQLVDWMTEESQLASIAAQGLPGLCALADPCMATLIERIAQHPSETSLAALDALVRNHIQSPHFPNDALTLQNDAVATIARWTARADLPPTLRETLDRARLEIQRVVDQSIRSP